MISLAGPAVAATVEFEFDPLNFPMPVNITNPLLPFDGGTLVFQGITDDECEVSKQTIGFAGPVSDGYSIPATVGGVYVLVVRDQEWLMDAEDGVCDYDGAELDEDTIDFFAEQNVDSEPGDGSAGSVWYLGEDTFSVPDEDEGPACSTGGAWRAGVNDAEPGLVMLAHPQPGLRYRQEFAEDVAEDWAAVQRLNGMPVIDFGAFTGCAVTREWSPLEPGAVEKKTYCGATAAFPGGLTLVEELTGGKTLRVEYIGPDLPAAMPGDGAAFPAFDDLGCDDPAGP